MNDFTKEDLKEYICMRRNAINSLIGDNQMPALIEEIEIIEMRAILKEFESMENWFL